MAKLKNFDNFGAGIDIFVPQSVRKALEDFDGGQVRQIRLYLAAPTKKAAVETLNGFGLTARTSYLRLGMGNNLDALERAGLLTEGVAYVLRQSDNFNAPVVQVDSTGARVIGRIVDGEFVAL